MKAFLRKVRNRVRRVFARPPSTSDLKFVEEAAARLARMPGAVTAPIFLKHGLHLLHKHYYLPLPEAEDLPADYFDRQSSLPGVTIDVETCRATMRQVAAYMPEFRARFPIEKTKDPRQFCLINGAYMAVDAHVYYGLIRHHKPRRIVEIGAGNSTLLSAAACLTNQGETGRTTELIAIEPYPWDLFKDGHPGLTELIPRKVQDVEMSLFESLGDGDILFIDSSHVLRAGNDVQLEYLEILPRLAPGVMVHVHDVSLPKAYPKVYFEQRLYWNEQDLLQAFLAFNGRFEVIWPGNYMMLKYPQEVLEVFPEMNRMRQEFPSSEPTAFWMRTKAG